MLDDIGKAIRPSNDSPAQWKTAEDGSWSSRHLRDMWWLEYRSSLVPSDHTLGGEGRDQPGGPQPAKHCHRGRMTQGSDDGNG
ncbi:hypothetical protein MHYP_G00303110 [Metynnis hypsauchen]